MRPAKAVPGTVYGGGVRLGTTIVLAVVLVAILLAAFIQFVIIGI